MSLLSRFGQALRSIVEDHQARREAKRFLKEYRAEQEAKIARGEAPPRFRSYKDYLQSRWWQRLRGHVLAYLSNECEFCAARAIQIHHVRYPRTRDLGSESIKSLYAVCIRCHDIAHGRNSGSTYTKCAFCGATATRTLKIEFKNHEQSTQRVCRRCDSLANGYRGQANGWPKEDYEEWVERWRQTMPALHDVLSPNEPVELVVDEIEATGGNAEDRFEEVGRLAAARKLVLEQREREFAARSTEELRSLWESRAQSDYDEDELHLLRSSIRRRLGYLQ